MEGKNLCKVIYMANIQAYNKNVHQLPPVPVKMGTEVPLFPKGYEKVQSGYLAESDTKRKKWQMRPPHVQNTVNICHGSSYDVNEESTQKNYTNLIYNVNEDDALHGNGDWIRGNRFSWKYKSPRVNYKYIVSGQPKRGRTYCNPDSFYPIPDAWVKKNPWFKTYPEKDRDSTLWTGRILEGFETNKVCGSFLLFIIFFMIMYKI